MGGIRRLVIEHGGKGLGGDQLLSGGPSFPQLLLCAVFLPATALQY